MSVGQMSVGQMSVGQMSVGQMFFDEMTRFVVPLVSVATSEEK
jgi:hypothetical protein